ncbi:MAG: flagellar hook-basal body protein, partial [Eubacterium sp.]|nr:flagellar hook-basal body protein [Eubacterium sp.]
IANNLSNINSTGYKTQTANFKSLIYQNMQVKTTTSTGEAKPIGAQVGLGTRIGSISSDFTQGALNTSNGRFDYAIQGDGFFMVQKDDGSTAYTRNGHFNMSITTTGTALTDSEGHPVLDTNGKPIVLAATYSTNKIAVDQYGNLAYPDANNNMQNIGIQIGLATFPNPGGLTKASESTYEMSVASGQATVTDAGSLGAVIKSGYLEGSNVQAADEMVNMIIAQRAYEMNSKAITASDEMLQQANNLRS